MEYGTEINDIKIESKYNVGEIKKGFSYSWENLFALYDDLHSDYLRLQEEFEDFKQDVEENYRPIPVSEQVGISDRDFI